MAISSGVSVLTKGLATGFDFVLSSSDLDIGKHLCVFGAFDGGLQRLEVVCVVEHLVALRVEVANLADVLFALRIGHGAIGVSHAAIVLNDLHRHAVALELEQVAHDALG